LRGAAQSDIKEKDSKPVLSRQNSGQVNRMIRSKSRTNLKKTTAANAGAVAHALLVEAAKRG
jgi:ribosomal protein S20